MSGRGLRLLAVAVGIGLAVVAALPLPVLGAPAAPERAWTERELAAETRAIAQELRCPVCQGQSVAESNSAVAIDMREEIRERLLAGWSREEILDAYVGRYGIWILNAPPRQGLFWLTWAAPFAILLAGGLVAVRVIRGRPAPEGAETVPPVPEEAEQEVERRLHDYL